MTSAESVDPFIQVFADELPEALRFGRDFVNIGEIPWSEASPELQAHWVSALVRFSEVRLREHFPQYQPRAVVDHTGPTTLIRFHPGVLPSLRADAWTEHGRSGQISRFNEHGTKIVIPIESDPCEGVTIPARYWTAHYLIRTVSEVLQVHAKRPFYGHFIPRAVGFELVFDEAPSGWN